MSALHIPVNIEASDISIALNGTIGIVFLMGMYTVIYFGTIYMYLTKNSSKYYPVPAAITILYLNSIAYMAFQWRLTKLQFVDNGDTRDSVFLATIENPQWFNIAIIVSSCIVYVMADGLLIWRCFHVWDRSLRMISVSLLLIITEFALFLVQISFHAKYINVLVGQALAVRLNALYSAAFFMSFATTFVTTTLIAYRIYSVSKQRGASYRRFKHVVDVVVQSGAVYALALLTAGIAGVLPGGDNPEVDTRQVALQNYGALLSFAIAAIASTVMVARVALLSADVTYPSTSVHLSGLQFHARSTHPTANIEATEHTNSVDGDRILAGGEHPIEAKAQ